MGDRLIVVLKMLTMSAKSIIQRDLGQGSKQWNIGIFHKVGGGGGGGSYIGLKHWILLNNHFQTYLFFFNFWVGGPYLRAWK